MIEGKKFFAIRGHNKSGTNWLGRILNLHPQISCTGEFHWHRITANLIETFHESENLYEQEGLLDAMWHRMDRFIKESIVLACDPDAIWVGDRTPSQIEPTVIMGARIFNLIRDGRDVLVSAAYHIFNNPDFFPTYSTNPELEESYRLFRADPSYFLRKPEQLLANDTFVRELIGFWVETVEKNQAQLESHPEVVAMEVRYESLHRETESERKRLYAFLDVDPELAKPLTPNTVAGFKEEKPNEFLRKGAIGDWKNYFTPRVKDLFNEVAGETLIRLGYVESLDWINEPTELCTEKSVVVQSELKAPLEPDEVDPQQVSETVGLMSRARSVLAYGGLDGVVQRPLFDHDGGVFPHFVVKAEGCRVTDTVGRTYIDWMNGWGPVLLGYGRPEIYDAIEKQKIAGPTLSLMHPLEIEVAQLLTEMIPCAQMVAFGKNGSDAVNASLRIARAVTGRKMILQCGFHGFHEWYTCLHPDVEGMPDGLREQVEPFPYNDLPALEKLLDQHKDNVAAVIMEPVNIRIPDEGYLAAVRELTEQHGCLFIFDEMVTAFRLANGGAQEHFGVVPDLACIGKGMANGMPLSAVVGKREYMQKLPGCGFGMTFRGETFSLAAAKTVLELLKRESICEHLASVGRKLRQRFKEVAQKIGLKCSLTGPDARLTVEFFDHGSFPKDYLKNLFLHECMKRGVITNGTFLPNYAHDDAAIEQSMVAISAALKVVNKALETGGFDSSLQAGPATPRSFVSNGFLEAINRTNGTLQVHGWMLLEDGAPDSVELVSANGDTIPADGCTRPDLQTAFPEHPSALQAGYQASLPEAVFRNGKDQYEFTIIAKRGPQVAFRCLVVKQSGDEDQMIGPFSTNDGVLYI